MNKGCSTNNCSTFSVNLFQTLRYTEVVNATQASHNFILIDLALYARTERSELVVPAIFVLK
ncbi:hypothetical protein BH11BAC5_BH11BAC5_23850 [soil metagenome]